MTKIITNNLVERGGGGFVVETETQLLYAIWKWSWRWKWIRIRGPGDNDTREICEKFTIILPGRQKISM